MNVVFNNSHYSFFRVNMGFFRRYEFISIRTKAFTDVMLVVI